jgi:hypothetical protein
MRLQQIQDDDKTVFFPIVGRSSISSIDVVYLIIWERKLLFCSVSKGSD